MNERIKELVKRAGGHFSTHNLMSNPVQHRESIELWDKNIEKFAELLVEECIDTVLDSSVEYATRSQIAEELKEHFGVEE